MSATHRARVADEHFEALEQQAHAARLGMWVFLASEVLLFGGALRALRLVPGALPGGVPRGGRHNTKVLGSINTGVLLVSSTAVACSVHALRAGSRALAARLVGATIALGAVFLAIKLTEYAKHFDEGIYPGGVGALLRGAPHARASRVLDALLRDDRAPRAARHRRASPSSA